LSFPSLAADLVIVPSLGFTGIVLVPNEADAVLIVDVNTVLTFAVTVQFLQTAATAGG
jgi:hypothetical protein